MEACDARYVVGRIYKQNRNVQVHLGSGSVFAAAGKGKTMNKYVRHFAKWPNGEYFSMARSYGRVINQK